MRRRAYWLLVPLVALLLAFVLFDHWSKSQPIEYGQVTRVHRGLNITTDPRTELISIVQYLSGTSVGISNSSFPYRERIYDAFWHLRGHEVVKMYEAMTETGFLHDAPPTFSLYLTLNFDLDETLQLPEHLLQRGGGAENLKEFAAALKDFSVESNFEAFFIENGQYYQSNLRNVAGDLGRSNVIGDLQRFTGIGFNSNNLIFVPLYCGQRSYATLIEQDQIKDNYVIFAPDLVRGPPQQWESEVRDAFKLSPDKLKLLIRTNYTNFALMEIPESYWAEAEEYAHLYEPIQVWMQRQGYLDWQTSLQQHLHRAVVVKVSYMDDKKVGKLMHGLYSNQRGFSYLNPLLDTLEQNYVGNREQYPDLKAFFPALLDFLQEIDTQTTTP